MTKPETTLTHNDVVKSAKKSMKERDAFILVTKSKAGEYGMSVTNLSKEHLAWVVALIQKEILKP